MKLIDDNPRVRIQIVDARPKHVRGKGPVKSKSLTIYEADVDETHSDLMRWLKSRAGKRREPAPA